MSQQIVISDGPEKGRVFNIQNGQTLVIGRGQQSDTKINDPYMSRIHCKIEVSSDSVFLLDGGGKNTLVDGSPIERHPLKAGDEFQAGKSLFCYVVAGHDGETTLRPNPTSTTNTKSQLTSVDSPKVKIPSLKELVGHTLASYRLEKIIAAGNSGFVYRATDIEKERIAAVKVLSPDATSTEEEKERFVRAMKTMLPIRHPNLVALWNAGKQGPFCWAAMEFIDGESMTDVIHRLGIDGKLDWRDVWRMGMDIASALNKAYEEKVIHRNVTPNNILRRKSDKSCLLGDLMLAKALDGALSKQVTSPGKMIGELPYMPPERTREGSVVDTRSDIYGLGATMYALLTGKAPFEATTTVELIRMIRESEPAAPRKFQLSINELFEAIVMKMLAKRPEDRYPTPASLLKELDRIGRYSGL